MVGAPIRSPIHGLQERQIRGLDAEAHLLRSTNVTVTSVSCAIAREGTYPTRPVTSPPLLTFIVWSRSKRSRQGNRLPSIGGGTRQQLRSEFWFAGAEPACLLVPVHPPKRRKPVTRSPTLRAVCFVANPLLDTDGGDVRGYRRDSRAMLRTRGTPAIWLWRDRVRVLQLEARIDPPRRASRSSTGSQAGLSQRS